LEIFGEILPEFSKEIEDLKSEAKELLAITVASINTARRNRKNECQSKT
jgi:hypothetical protein